MEQGTHAFLLLLAVDGPPRVPAPEPSTEVTALSEPAVRGLNWARPSLPGLSIVPQDQAQTSPMDQRCGLGRPIPRRADP